MEASLAIVEQGCAHECTVDTSDNTWQDCVEAGQQGMEDNREYWCFDGCLVDACLEKYHDYRDTCAEDGFQEAYEYCLHNGPFWDGTSGRSCGSPYQGF